MKKILLMLLTTVSLMANTAHVAEVNASAIQVQIEQNISPDTNTTEIPHVQSDWERKSLPMKAAVIVGTPIVVAGAVVAGVVLLPVYVVKKIFGSK